MFDLTCSWGLLCIKLFVSQSGSGRINSIEASLVVLVFVFSVVWSFHDRNEQPYRSWIYLLFFFKPFSVLKTKFFRDEHIYRRELMTVLFWYLQNQTILTGIVLLGKILMLKWCMWVSVWMVYTVRVKTMHVLLRVVSTKLLSFLVFCRMEKMIISAKYHR